MAAVPSPSGGLRLPGEPDDADELEDVWHWRTVYAQLVVGFRELVTLESKTRRRHRLVQVEQLEDRFSFWDARCTELRACSERDISDEAGPSPSSGA